MPFLIAIWIRAWGSQCLADFFRLFGFDCKMHLKSLIVLDCFTVYRRVGKQHCRDDLVGGNILLRNFPICGRHLICSLFVHQKWTLNIRAPKEKQLQPKTQPDESVYNGIAEQSKWINHILCLPKKNALENNGKSFFFLLYLSPQLHWLADTHIQKRQRRKHPREMMISSLHRRERKNMITITFRDEISLRLLI